MKDSTFITRVALKNYKSIAACDVRLKPLTFLVGRNGAGKSNFLDSLRFVADALNTSLEHAMHDRGGITNVGRRSPKRPSHSSHFSIGFEFEVPGGTVGNYAFRVRIRPPWGYEVYTEMCKFEKEYFYVKNGKVTGTSVKVAPAAANDRLYLVNASGLPEFRPVYEAFSQMGFYNLNPDKIRDIQRSASSQILTRDGGNLTSVLAQLSSAAKQRVQEYLAKVVPGVHLVEVINLEQNQALGFWQDVAGTNQLLGFPAYSMSDGTLRVLGILVALFQGDDAQKQMSLVGIEEPELALHPAAAGVLLDGLRDAAHRTQVIITSHSPDLLDNKDLDVDSILAVEARGGVTEIAQIDEAGISVLRDQLFTTGELLRLDQLQPDPVSVANAKSKQLELFNFGDQNSSEIKAKEKHE